MLRLRAENVWTVDHLLRLPGGVPFPTCMTVLRLPDGTLTLVSAVPIDDALAAELDALGPVSLVIAPNRMHHLGLPGAHRRYPEARMVGAPGLLDKHPDLPIEPLDFERSPAVRDVLAARSIDGVPKMAETVLLHRPSRTLIVTDLVFNIERPPSWLTSMMLAMTGTRGRLAQSRVWSFLKEDAGKARESCTRLFDWDFDRLICAHGEVIAEGARARLAAALTRTGGAPDDRALLRGATNSGP